MNKKFLILIIIFSTIILLGITFFIFTFFNKKSIDESPKFSVVNEITNDNDVNNIYNVEQLNTVNTNTNEVKLSPNGYITFLKYYKKCGHISKEKIKVTDNLVNLTKDELSQLYSDWQINKFTSLDVELYKEFDGNCGEHYLVKTTNGYITIYIMNDDNSVELKETTDIATKYLSLEDMNELENGVTLYGKEALNSYIENFE